jgi:hypothetical protein
MMGLKIALPRLRLRWFRSTPNHGSATSGLPTSNVAASKTWDTTVTPIPSWPQQGRPLKQHTWTTNVFLLGDVLLSVIPIYFICKSFVSFLPVTKYKKRLAV